MNDFLLITTAPHPLAQFPQTAGKPIRRKSRRGRKAEPGSYRSAAEYAGLSITHTFLILSGERATTPDKVRRLRTWAEQQRSRVEFETPAIRRALNLAA